MFKHEAFPSGIERRRFRQYGEEALQAFDFRSRRSHGQAQPVDPDRPYCDGPELDQILRHQIEATVLGTENCNCATGDTVQRMMRLQRTDEKVGIDEHARL
jgi:hypothetical protein